MTGGDVTIKNAIIQHMGCLLQAFEKLGIILDIDTNKDTIHIGKQDNLTIQKTIKDDDQEFKA